MSVFKPNIQTKQNPEFGDFSRIVLRYKNEFPLKYFFCKY